MYYKERFINDEPHKIYDFGNQKELVSDTVYGFPEEPDEWIEMFQQAKTIAEHVHIDVELDTTDGDGDSIITIKAVPYRFETAEEVNVRIENEKKMIDDAIEARRVFEEKTKAKEAKAEKDKQKATLDEAIRICEQNGYRVKPKKKSRQ